jgi:hypothetical protein
MAMYRKKPVVIEAVQLDWSTWNEICEFVTPEYFGGGVYLNGDIVLPEGQTSEVMGLRIKTLEGDMIGRQGDFIIKGVNGEFYPCKPDIFFKTYEVVNIEPIEGGQQ